jgi:hypothetical protein
MMLAFAVLGVVLAVLLRHRKLRLRRKVATAPLAGYDTGVRSAWRVPGRRWNRPHRGF